MSITYYVLLGVVSLVGFIFAYPAAKKPSPSTWNAGEKIGLMAMAAAAILVFVGMAFD